ncbi:MULTISPECIES: YggT family protein [unclassified Bartonella]|uniref:YggT family protein n=1 Tax=unclassified Bartonella TaxID=2645622 RepID=UPI0015F9AF52|nr:MULTISPECIES: YggT family protein [unclassified Bartonella]UXN03157.1 YggT family protein [Bartonella sp. HY406]UXN06120.1 YggT family protein [Bartonella sp. HY761]
MYAFFSTISLILDFIRILIVGRIIISWLYAMNIVNPRSQLFGMIGNFLYTATEPMLAPIRRILPDLGPIDISPIIIFFGIYFLQMLIATSLMPAFV